jgi:hypothetical protein
MWSMGIGMIRGVIGVRRVTDTDLMLLGFNYASLYRWREDELSLVIACTTPISLLFGLSDDVSW